MLLCSGVISVGPKRSADEAARPLGAEDGAVLAELQRLPMVRRVRVVEVVLGAARDRLQVQRSAGRCLEGDRGDDASVLRIVWSGAPFERDLEMTIAALDSREIPVGVILKGGEAG